MAIKDAAITTGNEIYINEIEFHSRTEIHLYGFINHGGQFVETRFSISRYDLQRVLSANCKTGVEILWHIENLFVHPHTVPAVINLVELFGTTLALSIDGDTLDGHSLDSLRYNFL